MRLKPALIVLASMFAVGTSQADGIPIEPGQWEMKSTMTISMMPTPKTTIATECIEKDVLDPGAFNMDDENPCDINDVKFESNTTSWTISCAGPDGSATKGSWQMTSHGDTLNGKGDMSMEIAGQEFGFDMIWEGKRIGDCE